ncbi:MAG: Asp23/Gls24 family envelope stress response protein [Oscillospiraceae bacterium]|nr:Asp23/Gls24 family envelope stress response protein [Oscillospiraceae bacterium]
MDDDKRKTDDVGGLVISGEVIAAIAVNAAKDIDGVTGIVPRAPGIVRSALRLGADDGRCVRVYNGENEIKIAMNITIAGGAKIPVVATAVQHGVKNAVQNMTGRVVSKVDVSIAGVEL